MSNRDFVKGECRHCGGHLEFPADALGETIPCPHCGQPTELAGLTSLNKTKVPSRVWPGVIVAVCLVAVGGIGVFFYLGKANHRVTPATSPAQPGPASGPSTSTNTSVAAPKPKIEAQTNDFAILPYKLEKTPGSSLVYVTGTIQNLSDTQRFGVKVEFGLSDRNDTVIGSATDYQSVMDPHGEWHFKALVMESKAASVQFNSISEDK